SLCSPLIMLLYAFQSCAFCSFADHRVLPSFPTRRSSDLRLVLCGSRRRRDDRRQGGARLVSAMGAGLGGVFQHVCGADRDVAALDRKSTRLNSSHVKISYAVFCLKKKKTMTVRTPRNHMF